MGEFEKGQNEDKFGQSEKTDKSAFQQLGDDKGEGGQQDIKTDSISAAQAKPDALAGAETGQDYDKQQGGQDLGQDKQQEQGEKFGEGKPGGESGKFPPEGTESQR